MPLPLNAGEVAEMPRRRRPFPYAALLLLMGAVAVAGWVYLYVVHQ